MRSQSQTKTPEKINRGRSRTYARNRAFSRTGREIVTESDGMYLMKLMLMVLLGSLWLKFGAPVALGGMYLNGVPLGLIIGLFLVYKYEQFQSNRKIWYALLIMVAIISYFLPSGIVL